FAWHQVLDQPRIVRGDTDLQRGSLLGPAYSTDEIAAWLDKTGAPYERLDDETLFDRTAEAIDQGKVVGWFSGRMEFGPRALGSRSILGDARRPETQRTMNLKIKYRESFRPFAPAVVAERASDYFELDVESPYMLLVAPVRQDRRIESSAVNGLSGLDRVNEVRSDVPAVTHVDYSARIQTV